MPTFDFDQINVNNDVEWPKRGRKKQPLPEQLVQSLHTSYANKATASVTIPNDKVASFANLLSKAGKELNYRIERFTQKLDNGYTIYHYRVKSFRKPEQANG